MLSGGPGCVHYLANERLAPTGFRCWFPHPRGVRPSHGGSHDMTRAIADLEAVRQAAGIDEWIVLGHSWGSDLAVRYALDHPRRVRGVVGIAGHGLHNDRGWSAAYDAGRAKEQPVRIDWVPPVHASLSKDFKEWIHTPQLWRRVADCRVHMTFLAAADDIRPDWPLRQLAELLPNGAFEVVDGADHNFWATDPRLWHEVCTRACRRLAELPRPGQ
ncbi:alpha/beta hydrolase [Tsukamurella sp. 8F]|uniref:alpha/beta fold hydrolase n=1 Tax=unclassified Tsukamurella TaxID=2633480 RepID=UPI0023B92D62|nr:MULTISPECIES: alpha/beta hydrolase [unclassified Tsukamurella]MDF0531525.1 alpha/beta hydrolase [Tsukamurella sp. 8J]MDF0588769.1 alpha/beta hydrolase [Tsukamurella sp. 8F]